MEKAREKIKMVWLQKENIIFELKRNVFRAVSEPDVCAQPFFQES